MSTHAPAAKRRPSCARCLRPTAACICGYVTPVHPSVELLVLQHLLEVSNAKGSARLLHLCLSGSRLLIGEQFSPEELNRSLHADGRVPLLLYPDTPGHALLGMPAPPPLPETLVAPSQLRLVVLDGTWRKSRKMLYLNPALHGLPRLPLRAMPPSHYRIRKAHAPDQLSTLEASCYALAQIEGERQKFQPILEAFDRFVDRIALHQTLGNSSDGAARTT